MAIRWKLVVQSFVLIGGCCLFSCTEKPKTQVREEVPEEDPVSIVVTHYAIGALVAELVDDRYIPVFDPVPETGESPTPEMIAVIDKTRPMVFVAGEQARWLDALSQKIGTVNLASSGAEEFEITADPTQALLALSKIEDNLRTHFPDVEFKKGAESFKQELVSYQEKWEAFAELSEEPEGIVTGVTRPEEDTDFLSMLKANYALYQEALEFDSKKMTFEGGIVRILENSCMECHDALSEEGDLNFEHYLTEAKASQHPDLWEKVAKVIALGQMPPPKEESLTESEKDRIYAWTESLTAQWDAGVMGDDPGKTTVHRLNKNEYNYTVRDLFGLKLRPADNFPEDGGGEGGFDNNADALYLPPLLVENYFKAAGQIVEAVYANPTSRGRYLIARPKYGLPAEKAAEKVLRYWSTFIYRKPANEEELSRLIGLFKEETAKKKKFDEAMKMPLYTMLISPNFLYRSTLTDIHTEPYAIGDFELASRLSYFLWSSMPDRELFKLASKGELSDPVVLEAQVKRMLLDEKSKALGMHFGGQWFGWELLRSSANPDMEKFPEFTFDLRVQLYQESMMFFNELIKQNGSAYDLLDSDYAYLNEALAKFYRIPGVSGGELRKVQLTDKNRGGVIGMGSVLTATSLSLRSSPSIRGAFVLKDLLGSKLPEPPMNIPQLPEDDREVIGKTFREALDQHRDDPNCSSCHAEIDPIGFGLEAFDAIGRFRTKQNGLVIDTTGQMPDGTKFSSPAELKEALLNSKEQFARNMVEKMLSYALGRDLIPFDRSTITKITEKVVADDAKIHTAFIEIVKSYPFPHRRGDDFKPKTTALN